MKKQFLLVIAFCASIAIGLNFKSSVYVPVQSTEAQDASLEKEAAFDEPEKFYEFHREIRTRDSELIPAYPFGYKLKELRMAKANARNKSKDARTKLNGVLSWDERGPSNVPGRTRTVLPLPSDPQKHWLAGSATGGIWKTTDAGASWREKSIDFLAYPISSLAMSSSDPNVVYAGTGELISTLSSAIGAGIYKSTDQGETWAQLASTANDEFALTTRIIVDPENANILLASCIPQTAGAFTSTIQKSVDGGATWTMVYETSRPIEQLVATPGNFDILYGTVNRVGVIKSTNGGASWALSSSGINPAGRIELAISPQNPNQIFAGTVGNLSKTGSDLYLSRDAGATWALVNVAIEGTPVDFHGGQGFYDNAILADPFDANKVYIGGVDLYKTQVGSNSTTIVNYTVEEESTSNFLSLINFGADYYGGRLEVASSMPAISVEVRFGPGRTQKAHRFEVPAGASSGVPAQDYAYKNYVDVPFQVWDMTNNRQLMASFRDQGRDGQFNLIESSTEGDASLQSREYLYIHDVTYSSTTPDANIAKSGGHEVNNIYFVWPVLPAGGTWPPASNGILRIESTSLEVITATTQAVSQWNGSLNEMDQVNIGNGFHPDHHTLVAIPVNTGAKTYRILVGNDGGVFLSKTSTSPGTSDGDWAFTGNGYNTSQFYGADKNPNKDQYIGGLQDNGTRISPANQSAAAGTAYNFAMGGDGFEVLWHSQDETKIIGSIYNNRFMRSTNGGQSFQNAFTGLTLSGGAPDPAKYPFFSKLSHSKNNPDILFTVGSDGVWRSTDFAGSWTLSPITEKFVLNNSPTSALDVEVSRANGNIIWAGSGMSSTAGSERNLFVSTDGGDSFDATQNYNDVVLGSITRLASHPTEQQTAYALFSFADSPKILRTTDLGQSWEDISGFGTGTASANGFPDVAVYCLYVRADNPNILWAGTEIGIVESLDNGQSWNMLTDFPNVAVWDMKGQNDQVVIATHGRGIWTATIDQAQLSDVSPTIIAHGTSPQNELALRIETAYDYDSLEVLINQTYAGTLKNVAIGTFDLDITGVPQGNVSVSLVSYIGNAPYTSTKQIAKVGALSLQPSYATYFQNATDLSLNNLVLGKLEGGVGTRSALQTNHNYQVNRDYSALIRTPVTVSATNAYFYYSDVAIVEPTNDYVVVEATKNGLDWTALSPQYDANHSADWLNAYNIGTRGNRSLLIDHEIDLLEKFNAGDELLFRMRMSSGTSVTSWGWAIDYISIQEIPLSAERTTNNSSLTIYPNPSKGMFNIAYNVAVASPVEISVRDLFGKTIRHQHLGIKSAGSHTENMSLSATPGTYFIIVQTKDGKQVDKISIIE